MNVEQLKNPTFDFKHYQDEKQENEVQFQDAKLSSTFKLSNDVDMN